MKLVPLFALRDHIDQRRENSRLISPAWSRKTPIR
jgi:hypothetical protein